MKKFVMIKKATTKYHKSSFQKVNKKRDFLLRGLADWHPSHPDSPHFFSVLNGSVFQKVLVVG